MSGVRYQPFEHGAVTLLPGMLQRRRDLNRYYLMSLDSDALTFNHRFEAVLCQTHRDHPQHGGWEQPGCQLKGHFLGHWLSAAARTYAETGDEQLKAKADGIVADLKKCQDQNGNGWAGSIPEKYLEKVVRKQGVWAPHYTLHKILMGLYEMYAVAGNELALQIMIDFAEWFHRWTSQFDREQMDDILDYETGGMLEAWGDLYGVTKDPKHLDLIERYYRGRLFEPIRRGEDPLSLRHANTMIPEVIGAARAWEVTGDPKYREIAEKFWDAVVPDRMYATGGHTHGEVWSEPGKLAGTLVEENQELCTVYNMMWLTKYLFQWTGDPKYADYYERNLYNGVLSAHHPGTGMFTYYHSFKTGGRKKWGSRTESFWCCYGTGVQAIAELSNGIYFHNKNSVIVNVYAPSRVVWRRRSADVTITQETQFPDEETTRFAVSCSKPQVFTLALRIPWWASEGVELKVNGEASAATFEPSSYQELSRKWRDGDTVELTLPMPLRAWPMPDDASLVAVMHGPLVLAGLTDRDVELRGDPEDAASWVQPADDGRTFRAGKLAMVPMHRVVDERFGIYFPQKG
jgi:DUF1680 family protein